MERNVVTSFCRNFVLVNHSVKSEAFFILNSVKFLLQQHSSKMFRKQNLKFKFVFTLMRNFRIVTDFKYARCKVSDNVRLLYNA